MTDPQWQEPPNRQIGSALTGRRVLHVVEGLDDHLGGLQTAVILIANAQARAGHRVIIAAGSTPERSRDNLRELDPRVEVRLFPYSKLTGRVSGSRKLRKWLGPAVSGADVVHTHGIWSLPPFWAATLALARSKRLLMSLHGSLESYDLRKHGSLKRALGAVFVRPLLVRSDGVVCTTQREADGMETYGASPRLFVIPIPPGATSPPSSSRATFRAEHGIDIDEVVVLFLGRFDHKKGLHLLVQAFARLPPDLRARLLVVGGGGGGYARSVRRDVHELGLVDRVTWAGWLSGSDKAAAYLASDVFALLSYNENYGITVVEAAQHGLPVVLTSDVYASGELLACGAAVETTRDPADAAEAIERLLLNRTARSSMRAAAERFTTTVLDEAAIADQYSQLIS